MDLIKWHLGHKKPLGIDELCFDYVFENDKIVCQVRGKSAEQCRGRAQEIIEAHNRCVESRTKYYAIVFVEDNSVVGCTCEPDWQEEGHKFVEITKEQFDTYGEDPGKWTKLEEIDV